MAHWRVSCKAGNGAARITRTLAPHATLQPKSRRINHLNTRLNSVESTLDAIAYFTTRELSGPPLARGAVVRALPRGN